MKKNDLIVTKTVLSEKEYYLLHRTLFFNTTFKIFLVLLLLYTFGIAINFFDIGVFVLALLSYLFFYLFFFFFFKKNIVKEYHQKYQKPKIIKYEFGKESVKISVDYLKEVISYDNFYKIKETHNNIYLFISKNEVYILVKTNIKSPQKLLKKLRMK